MPDITGLPIRTADGYKGMRWAIVVQVVMMWRLAAAIGGQHTVAAELSI